MNRVAALNKALLVLLILALPGWVQAVEDKRTPRVIKALELGEGPFVREDGRMGIWVRFTDRNLTPAELEAALVAAEVDLDPRAARRRAKVVQPGGSLVSESDLPVAGSYIEAVQAVGAEFRKESRWLNAASFNVHEDQIEAIVRLPFVDEVDLVAGLVRPEIEPSAEDLASMERAQAEFEAQKAGEWNLNYGGSRQGLELMDFPPVHEMGLTGKGVVIGIMDTGYELFHEAMQHVTVVDAWDFINDDPDVYDNWEDPDNQGQHGTEALSLLVGLKEGSMVGAAYNASVILAKTEETDTEHRREDDNWIAALEWMESLGVDVVSSSVGYYEWYDYSELDGLTARITLAADMAVSRGVVVATAAGNLAQDIGIPPILAPSDGRKVISVGEVDLNGNVTATSSRGPTYDGRIKPDVVALGSGAVVASWWADWIYTENFGTSMSTQFVAGLAALILERNPELTPLQVREAIRSTANNADQPDNDSGWGLVNAYDAVTYWGPTIDHEPVVGTDNYADPVTITATITGLQPLDTSNLLLTYRVSLGPWQTLQLNSVGGDVYSADIPPLASGSFVEYYLQAADQSGWMITDPLVLEPLAHFFIMGTDNVGPELVHYYLSDQVLAQWPPAVTALAVDPAGIDQVELYYSISGGPEQGPFDMIPGEKEFELDFPVDGGALAPGDRITYRLAAQDASNNANSTAAGPFHFDVVTSKGKILYVDDRYVSKAYTGELPDTGHGVPPELTGVDMAKAEDIPGWIADAGYEVVVTTTADIKEGSFDGFNVVVVNSGGNYYPIINEEFRTQLIQHAENGGKIVSAGGEVGWASLGAPIYAEYAEAVLHASDYVSEGGYVQNMTFGMSGHPFLNRGNRLPSTMEMEIPVGYLDYAASDVVLAGEDAQVLYSTTYGATTGGTVVSDNNTCLEAGQTVYFPWNPGLVKPAIVRQFMENALIYLLVEEPPGRSEISGQILLEGSVDHSGVLVGTDTLHTTLTDEDGNYVLSGVWGGTYKLTASKDGYSSRTLDIQLEDDQTLSGIDLTLVPVTVVDLESNQSIPIPDNNPTGISSPIEVQETGTVQGVTVWVDIQHYSINNLVVKLVSPSGTEVVLHNRTGGTADNIVGSWPDVLYVDGPGELDDFLDEAAHGTWALEVSDNQFGATGTLNSWGMQLLVSSSVAVASGGDTQRVLRILGNAPNPFNPRTVISFELARSGPAKLQVFDMRGRMVRRLMDRSLEAGRHQMVWNGLDEAGTQVASGIYFYRLDADRQSLVGKMMLVR